MVHDEKRDNEGREDRLSGIPSGVKLLLTFWLYQVALGTATQLLVLSTNTPQHSEDFPTSPWGIACLIAWSGAAGFVWGCLKYSPKAGSLLFFLATCFWVLSFLGRADTPEELMSADFGHRMFYACLTALIVCMIRLVLGEGRQQTATLKRMVGISTPDLNRPAALPQESLLRASSHPEAPHDTLLRPARDTQETAPKQLLRASQPEDQ